MELRLLRYFLTIAEEGTISQAALVLHITQPTLSRQLRLLEEELDAALFERSGNHLVLTDAGLFLQDRAREILALTDDTAHDFAQRRQELFAGKINIGCVEADNSDTLAMLLEEMIADYPAVSFEVFTGTSDIIQDRLDKGLEDLAILLEPVATEKYHTLRLPRLERWGLATAAASFLAQKTAITASDLIGIPLMMPGRASVQKLLGDWLEGDVGTLNVIGNHNLIFNALPLIENQTASALTIEGALGRYQSDAIRFIPLTPALATHCVLVWRQGRVLTPVAQELLRRFQEAFGGHASKA
ncbi:LysR family transcriptional regulator [Lacticaseibacillus mingshuiensis]|uniref:LysR family transcriptional regulator n=1 Tax=Lacticaseibacillus mingshuiensis TaxID=2799574 RepID=A0ABW4CLR2_9LACO|nr:LysR family transcriptional regulator [Lacticaseibacillus mingshuiensis]